MCGQVFISLLFGFLFLRLISHIGESSGNSVSAETATSSSPSHLWESINWDKTSSWLVHRSNFLTIFSHPGILAWRGISHIGRALGALPLHAACLCLPDALHSRFSLRFRLLVCCRLFLSRSGRCGGKPLWVRDLTYYNPFFYDFCLILDALGRWNICGFSHPFISPWCCSLAFVGSF